MTTITNKWHSCLTVLFLLSCLFSSNAFSAITDVSRSGDSVNCKPALGGGLNDGETAYCDQSYTWTEFPPEADGILLDYIIVLITVCLSLSIYLASYSCSLTLLLMLESICHGLKAMVT